MHRLKKLLLVSGASIGLLAPSEGKEFNERVDTLARTAAEKFK